MAFKGNLSDIISINRYYGWYANTGELDMIGYRLRDDIQNWHDIHKKPIMVTEYGADTFAGVHCVNFILNHFITHELLYITIVSRKNVL